MFLKVYSPDVTYPRWSPESISTPRCSSASLLHSLYAARTLVPFWTSTFMPLKNTGRVISTLLLLQSISFDEIAFRTSKLPERNASNMEPAEE